MAENLPNLIEKFEPHFVGANVENICGGRGARESDLKFLQNLGVDFFTGGNHIFDHEKVFRAKIAENFLISPGNFEENFRNGAKILQKKNHRILVLNLSGRIFMKPNLVNCPFRTLEKILKKFENEKFDARILDFHAETTSEKYAMKFFAEQNLTAIFGTHTHIATADAQIKNGSFFVSDVGFCGPRESLIGFSFDSVFPQFFGKKSIFEVEKNGPRILNGYFLEIKNSKVCNFERIEIID